MDNHAHADGLLAEIAPISHHDRMRKMVDLGRRVAAGDAEARAIVASLSGRANAYPKLLALQTAFGSRDGHLVLAMIEDRSTLVRGRARSLVPSCCDDAQALEALDRVPRGRIAAGIARSLRRRGRVAVLDAFLAKVLGGPHPNGFDGKVVDLVPYASPAAQSLYSEALREASSPVTWTRRAVWQPASAADELLAILTADGAPDPRAWWRVGTMLPVLATHAPREALRVAQAMLRKTGDPSDHVLRRVLVELAKRLPAETFDLLREVHESSRPAKPPGAFGFVRFDTHTERLGADRILYLIKLGGAPLPDRKKGIHWLRRLSEPDRDRVARGFLTDGRGSWGAFLFRHFVKLDADLTSLRERAFTRWRDASQRKDGAIDVEHLAWLPADLRIREARRHLDDVADLVAKPRERRAYAALLPFADAKIALEKWLSHPEGEERAAALRVWIASVRFEPASLPDALAAVKARRFEQDPVRLAMLDALGQIPLHMFTSAHLEAVSRVVQDALDAADLSYSTAAAAERLIVRLFRKDAAWGAERLAKLLSVRGSIAATGLGDGLTAAEVKVLAPHIAALAQSWMTRERSGALIWLAESLGKRLPLVEDLVLALELCAQDLPFVSVADRSLDLLAEHARPRFAALVPRLLEQDRSFAILSRVARFVSRTRQDLLDPLLEDRPMTGRFATGKTGWVIDFGGGYARWTDRQQAALARGLLAITSDAQRDVPGLLSALESLVELAFIDPAPAIALASDPRPPVRERAVRYLPRLDGGEGLPVLVECLGDDRSRFAIYALRKAFAEMRPPAVLAVLRTAPFTKVTVAKEVLRLIGEIPGEEAFRALLSFDREGLHRDVRIAMLRAMWDHLDRDEAWVLFERAAADKDWVIVSRLADIPVARLSAAAESRLARLLARVLDRPEIEARIDLLKPVAYLPLRDAERALFGACLLRMAGPHPDESRAATDAVLQRMQADEVPAVVRRFEALTVRRRLLQGFIDAVKSRMGPHSPGHFMRVGQGLLDLLRADPLLVPLAIRFAPKLLDHKQLAAMLRDLSERDLLHADAMAAALDAAHHTLHPEQLEDHLAFEADPRLRRIALAALASASGAGHGWSKERRERLTRFQSDLSPLVAGAAQFVFPPT